MKIVIDARESGTTSGRYVDKLLEYLQKIDIKNEYYILLKSHRLDSYKSMPENFHAVECNVKEFTFAEQFKLLKVINNLKPDLVHFPMVQQPILYLGKTVTTMQDLTTLRFSNPSKNPVIFKIKQAVYLIVNYVAVRKSTKLIAISEFTKKDVIKTLHYNQPEKFTITYEAADELPKPSENIQELDGKKFIMYVGRHQPHKNLERLIDAHQLLLKNNPDTVLAIVGKKDKTTEILENKVTSNGYKNILFTGFVTDQQLRWLYENTACYVFPSLSEGFGLPGLEAMVHGAPVTSSNATCLPEIYGDAANYFDPKNIEDIANKINEILTSEKTRNGLINKGYEQAKKYSWDRMARQTLEVYESVLNS